ncbi:MAG: tRNA pseudouridine13 synthase [Candidatus Nitrosomirales archaeon]|jgi:tRNA pseudouridine13 synthase
MNVPAIDLAIGMEVYSTKLLGIDGKIKQAPDQFVVEEIIDSSLDLSTNSDSEHLYPLYLLKKNSVDSNHAVQEVEVATGLKLKVVGLKDAKAVTTQYASVSTKQRNAKNNLATEHCALDLVGYTSRPIAKGILVANRFIIKINDFHGNVQQSVAGLQECIEKNAVANFYGYQRFGSSRPVTHLVGREIVKRNFKEAVNLFLGYSNDNENEHNKEIREMCKDDSNFEHVLKVMPSKMDLERILIEELLKSNDPVKAIRRLPITIRRMLVQAYQSYIFNKTLSTAIKEGYEVALPKQNDICFSFTDDGFNMTGMNRYDENAKNLQLPTIPLAGYAFRDNNRFSAIVRKVMEEESVSMKDFYIRELQEISVEGGFRQASMLCREFSYSLNDSLETKFVLNKGSYATILLRELMKPSDPMKAGF